MASSNFTVEFLYTTEYDNCVLDGTSFYQGGSTMNGGLCAYVPSIERMYSCWANTSGCWQWYITCDSGQADKQVTCNNGGTTWCCNNIEVCSTGTQINVCGGQWANPHYNWTLDAMLSAEYSALGISTLTTTGTSSFTASQLLVTTPASVFSTSTVFLNQAGVSESPTSSSSSATTAGSTTARSAATSATNSPALQSPTTSGAAAATTNTNNSGLSGGAIAGVVVGALAIICLTLVAAFFMWSRHKRRAATPQSTAETDQYGKYEKDGKGIAVGKSRWEQAKVRHDGLRHEMTGEGTPAEMGVGERRAELEP